MRDLQVVMCISLVAAVTAGAAVAQDSAAESPTVGDASATTVEQVGEVSPDSQAGPPAGVEVFRVRERKLSAIETDVPDSVTTFDSSTLEALGAKNISDLSKVTPNVEITTSGATQATFFIRGVGLQDFSSNSTGAVAIMQDRVSVNAAPLQLGQLFDIQTVEVLRGPQAFSSMRNASAGAIRVSAVKPTGYHSASLRVSLGSWLPGSDGAFNGLIQDYEGSVEVPILQDVLSTRLSFRFRDAAPYATNGCGDALPVEDRTRRVFNTNLEEASLCGELDRFSSLPDFEVSRIPEGLPTRVGDEHNWALRGQLRLVPEDSEMDWLLKVHGSRLDQQSTLGQALGTGRLPAAGTGLGGVLGLDLNNNYWEPDQAEEWRELCGLFQGRCLKMDNFEAKETLETNLASDRPLDTRPYRGDYNRVGQTQLDTWGGALTFDMELEHATIRAVSAYDGWKRSIDQDTDFTPEVRFESLNDDEAWQFWQEVGASGELEDEPISWDLGGYFFMEELNFDGRLLTQFDALSVGREYTQGIRGFALWGSFQWEFLDDFTLEGGVRYNWEKKTFDFKRFFPEAPVIAPQFQVDEITWDAPTGGVSLTYRVNDTVSAYAKYSRGFKPGHFNALSNEPTGSSVARPESLDAFEVGLRGAWLDGRLRLASSFFYYIYEDYQVFLFTTIPNAAPVLDVVNAEEVENLGAELELDLEPLAGLVPEVVEGLRIGVRFAWLKSEFIDFQNETFLRNEFGDVIPVTEDYTGNRLPNSPKFTVSGSAAWKLDLGRWGALTPRYDFAWTDDIVYDPNNGQGSFNQAGIGLLPENTIGQAAYVIHSVRLSYQAPSGNMEIAAWGRNLADEVYKNFAFDASRFTSSVITFVGRPRTVGADVSFSF